MLRKFTVNYPSEFALLIAKLRLIANMSTVQRIFLFFNSTKFPPYNRTLCSANLAHSLAEHFFSYIHLRHVRESFGFFSFL